MNFDNEIIPMGYYSGGECEIRYESSFRTL